MSSANSLIWQANRTRLRREIKGVDLVVLAANDRQQRSNDTAYPFRQDSNFYYYTGIDEPGFTLVIDLVGDREWLIEPAMSKSEVVFEGKPDTAKLESISQLPIKKHDEGWRLLNSVLRSGLRIGTVPEIGQSLLSLNQSHNRLYQKLTTATTKLQIENILTDIYRQRSIKQDWELAHIQSAIDITAKAFEAVIKNLKNFETEKDIEKSLTKTFLDFNCDHAYEPIVASGKNALTLHYTKNNSTLKTGELLLIDAGAEFENYCADITRTYPIGQQLSDRQRSVYDAVLSLQEFAINLLRPGLSIRDYARRVDDQTKFEIKKLGLEATRFRQYLPHGISHGLGLDVHDHLASETFKPGMVLTVEPGIYIKAENIGVRIEDDVLITESGNRILSSAISKTV